MIRTQITTSRYPNPVPWFVTFALIEINVSQLLICLFSEYRWRLCYSGWFTDLHSSAGCMFSPHTWGMEVRQQGSIKGAEIIMRHRNKGGHHRLFLSQDNGSLISHLKLLYAQYRGAENIHKCLMKALIFQSVCLLACLNASDCSVFPSCAISNRGA